MALEEQRFVRDGVPVPIQCILMTQKQGANENNFHYHEYTELLFGVSGVATVYVGKDKYPLSPGDTVIVHSYDIHNVTGGEEESRYIVIKFLPSILLTPEQSYREYSYALFLMQNTEARQNYFPSGSFPDAPIASLFHHALNEWTEHQFGYELGLRSDVTTIFMHILRKWQEGNRDTVSLSAWQGELVEKTIAYIHKNYVDLTEESTAKELSVSPSYLSRTFKAAMHVSFSAYVNAVKLREAERMLISTDLNVTEIGEAVGFSTSSYFISAFRKRHGMTPQKYRTVYRG